jgi:hypothetical protein
MNPIIKKLRRQMLSAPYSEDIIRLLFTIARTGDPDAIRVVADQMDVPCDVGRAAVRALIEMGPAVLPEMHERLEADDEDMVRNAHKVLAHFGRQESRRALDVECWADLEEEKEEAAE